MDAFRLAVADAVTKVYPELPLKTVYDTVATGALKGVDCNIATPRFKAFIKGDPKQIAEKIAKEVRGGIRRVLSPPGICLETPES